MNGLMNEEFELLWVVLSRIAAAITITTFLLHQINSFQKKHDLVDI